MTDEQNERAAKVANAVFPLLWKAECYNGITLRDVDDCRIGGRLDMGGRVERYEKQAEDIAQAATAVLAREFEADRVRIEALEGENARLREALEEIMDLPGEINPSNYDHDDVCELNRQFCYGYVIARAALKDTNA